MRDLTAVSGLLLLGAGCSWAWPPLGLIVVGFVLLAGAVCGHLRTTPLKETPDEAPR